MVIPSAEWIAIAIDNVQSAAAERVRLTIGRPSRNADLWARELRRRTLGTTASLPVLLSGTRRRTAMGPVSPSLDERPSGSDEGIVPSCAG